MLLLLCPDQISGGHFVVVETVADTRDVSERQRATTKAGRRQQGKSACQVRL